MLGEINRDFYCSSKDYNELSGNCIRICEPCVSCGCKHRKWPTPEQFKEEYGEEYPDEAPVWYRYSRGDDEDSFGLWGLQHLDMIEGMIEEKDQVVCACTPFGKPDEDWRPE